VQVFHVDAFTSKLFRGNPAAVVPLGGNTWPADALMQAIAAENNLSETAFLLPAVASGAAREAGADYHLRWLTPALEVELCGHATLASAHVLFEELKFQRPVVRFWTLSGMVSVERGHEGMLILDFPAVPIERVAGESAVERALDICPREVYRAAKGVSGHAVNWLAVFDLARLVRDCVPDFRALPSVGDGYLCITAPGDEPQVDFVSRYFAPAGGIDEDPVTGSTHCMLTPYWSKRLGKKKLRALQVSKRGGELICEDKGARVGIAGRAVTYLEGTMRIEPR
jgi:PhzF family phenazine biosynthesis protein